MLPLFFLYGKSFFVVVKRLFCKIVQLAGMQRKEKTRKLQAAEAASGGKVQAAKIAIRYVWIDEKDSA